jgi:hypothetical protein
MKIFSHDTSENYAQKRIKFSIRTVMKKHKKAFSYNKLQYKPLKSSITIQVKNTHKNDEEFQAG